MWNEMKVEHYELFYLAGSFAVQNFTETYVDNSTFCYEGSVQDYPPNYPPDKNFLISSGNKSKINLPEDSFSKIPSGIDTPIPSEDKFNSVIPSISIPSGITLPITMGTNSSIPSGDIFRFHLGTCPILQNIPMSPQPKSIHLTTPRYF